MSHRPLTTVRSLTDIDGPMLFATELMQPDARVTPAHAHPRGQLLGAMRGLLSVDARDSRWVVPAIHAVWIPPGVMHGLRSHGPYAGWSVYVAPEHCADLPGAPCTLRSTGLLREAVARAAQWKEEGTGGVRDVPRLNVAGVILDEIRTAPHEPLGLPLPADARLRKVAQALCDEPASDRSADAWAAWAGIAPRTFTRRFAAETGFAFTEWRQRVRVLRALELLAQGASVKSVALGLGYGNVSAFIAMFKRAFGVTPAKYGIGATS